MRNYEELEKLIENNYSESERKLICLPKLSELSDD